LDERSRDGAAVTRTAGVADLYIGLKLALTPQEGILPEMALSPQALVPTGSPGFTSGQFLPGLNWLYSWEITDQLWAAGSTQANRVVERLEPFQLPIGGGSAEEAFTMFAQSAEIGYKFTEQFGFYTEWFAFFPHGARAARPEHYLNGGFTYLFSNDVQWDIRAGWGLNDAARDFFCGTGLSVRFW
jgi:hypothetical protein